MVSPLSKLADKREPKSKSKAKASIGEPLDLKPYDRALGVVWGKLQSRRVLGSVRIPNVTFTLHTRRLTKKGAQYFPNTGEVRFNLRCFSEGPSFVLVELIHEAAHALSIARGVRDGNGNWHNAEFRHSIELLGAKATCPKENERAHGFSIVTFEPHKFADELIVLNNVPDLALPEEAKPATPHPESGMVSASCGCGRTIKATRKHLREGVVYCRKCNRPFIGGKIVR